MRRLIFQIWVLVVVSAGLASLFVTLLLEAPPVATNALINDAVLNTGNLPQAPLRRVREVVPVAPSELSSTTGTRLANSPAPGEAAPVPVAEVQPDIRRPTPAKSKKSSNSGETAEHVFGLAVLIIRPGVRRADRAFTSARHSGIAQSDAGLWPAVPSV